jgi:3',5'-cyclic AMP phosphodiesterase CpdA
VKLVITADLHYDIARSQEPTRRLAEEVCGLRADALLVLGDVAGREIGIVDECLRLFDGFAGSKFFVAGNHDIWTHPGECSLERFESTLPRACRGAGFHPLDVEPAEIDGVGLVGCMGWYDYTFLPPEPRIPLRFYQAKIAPGAADRLGGYESLLADRSDVPDWAWDIGTRWMDGEHVRLPMSDEAFCERQIQQLASHLAWAERRCRQIVVGLHHVPYRELVPVLSGLPPPAGQRAEPKWFFTAPYMGSARMGELLLGHAGVSHVYCGHTHWPLQCRRGHIECINVGCTYLEKRYHLLEV